MGRSTMLVLVSMVVIASAQRPFYAGFRPIGYPEVADNDINLGNRFGGDGANADPLPVDALGDRGLVNRISQLPQDQQPFWYLNWKQIEEHRRNPQVPPVNIGNSFQG